MSKKSNIQAQTLKIPKIIIYSAKFLEVISPKLAMLFAAKLFTTPIKHRIPKRELHMIQNSKQEKIIIPVINKEIVVYHYGTGKKKILLAHGWSGRGTQLVKIADALLENDYSIVSFDAPAHGKSKGNSTIMVEFIASILEIEKQFGPFEFAVGHSLGGMSILNAVNQNLKIKKAVIIGSGDIIQDIINDFIKKMQLNPQIGIDLKKHFEKKYNEKMENYASSNVAKNINIPILIIHDKDDIDVNVKVAENIHQNLKNSELMFTENLGHRKILGNPKVINKIVEYLNQ